jgi:HEAT repeat protein
VDLLRSLASRHEDREVRHRAITYLGRRPEETAGILEGIFETAAEISDRAEALEALADRLGPSSKDRLVRTARDREEDAGLRRVAVAYLSRVPGGDVDRALEDLLSDADERLREEVVEAWERREPRRAVPLLERVAGDDGSRRVRLQCVASLGDIEGNEATRALERLFGSEEDEEMRVEALQELAPRRAEGRADWLAGLALNDVSIEVRKEAVRQLGRMGDDPAARRALQRIIDVGRL